MEFIRKAKKLGNSAGVLLPKELLGADIRVTVVKRPVDIKRETLKLIDSYLPYILGVYVTNNSPAEALVVSSNIKKIIEGEKIKIKMLPLSMIRRGIKTKQILRDKIIKAKTILNRSLLVELKREIREL